VQVKSEVDKLFDELDEGDKLSEMEPCSVSCKPVPHSQNFLGKSYKDILTQSLTFYLLIHDLITSRNNIQHDAKIRNVNYNYYCVII